jgi:hypothetical protein
VAGGLFDYYQASNQVSLSANPFTDEQLNLLGTVPKQVCHFSSLYIFSLGCKMISRQAARRLIVFHPE